MTQINHAPQGDHFMSFGLLTAMALRSTVLTRTTVPRLENGFAMFHLRIAMRKTISMLLLAVVSGNAAADWIPISRDGDISFYIDRSTIVKAGARVRMWNMFDFEVAQAVPGEMEASFWSSMTQQEFDCRQLQYRIIYVHFHSGKMGLGEVIQSTAGRAEWKPMPSGGTLAMLWKLACGT